jgi:DNA-directed RNA polymerase specialized sigma24 family protein
MKIKKTRLLQIIQEEISRINEAGMSPDDPDLEASDALLKRIKSGAQMIGTELTPDEKNKAFEVLNNPDSPYNEKERAFNALVSDFSARFVVRPGKETEDDLQNAFVQAYEYFLNKDGTLENSKFGTWIKSVAKKRFIDAIRKFARESNFAGTAGRPGQSSIVDVSDAAQLGRIPVGHIPGPLELLLQKERYGAFGELLQAIESDEIGLSDNEKRVLYNQIDDSPASTNELADALGVPFGQIGSLSSRARQKIKNWIENLEISSREKNKILSVFSGGVGSGDLQEEMFNESSDLPPGLVPAKDDLRDSIRAEVDEMHPGLKEFDPTAYEGLVNFMASETEAEDDDLRCEGYLEPKSTKFPSVGYKDPKGLGTIGDLEEAIKEAIKELL